MTEIPASEFHRRAGGVRTWMRSSEIDALVITRPENVYYLSNFRAAAIAAWTARFHGLVVPAYRQPRLLARALEVESAASQWTADPMLWRDHEDPYRMVADAVADGNSNGAGMRVGIEKANLTVAQLEELAQALPDAEFLDCSGVVERMAAELSESEVGCMRKAAAVAQAGMDVALQRTVIGHYPYEVVGAVQEAMYAAGQSDFEKSFVAVWSGPRGGMMHDTRTTQQFVAGDVATIEIMGVDRQYLACVQTCLVLGSEEPPREVREAYEMVVAMHSAARSSVRPGVTSGEVFEAANTVYKGRTGDDYFRRVGGSMGLTMFALDLVKDGQERLPEGMPLLIQTLVTEPVLLTCATTILVTDGGYDELTTPAIWSGGPTASSR